MSPGSAIASVDVAVAGAGFAGLALATVCAEAGLRVAVLERRGALEPEGVALQLQPNGLEALDALGVVDAVLARGHPISTVQQHDGAGRLRATLRYDELHHPHPYLCGIRRRDLVAILADRLPEAVVLRAGCAVTALERADNGRVVGLRYDGPDGRGHVLRAGLVVGADGVASAVRAAMGAVQRFRTGPDPFVIGISERRPADTVARVYCGDGFCNGVLPYGEHTYFFDHVTDANRAAVEGRDLEAWKRVYAQRVPDGAKIVAPIASFDDVALLTGRTHWATPRASPGVVLIGDAAAAVHPHSGQGANQALIDARVLGQALARHGAAADEAIAAAARLRARATRVLVPWSVLTGRALDGPRAGWRAVRWAGYGLGHVGPARRMLVRRQAGLP